jgi:hypothetical protein
MGSTTCVDLRNTVPVANRKSAHAPDVIRIIVTHDNADHAS